MSKPFIPTVQRTAPPEVSFSSVVTTCPVCQRLAFGVVATSGGQLVGSRQRSRLAGIECPWCLHVIEYDEAGQTKVMALPLDLPAQVRQSLANSQQAMPSGDNPMQPDHENAALQSAQ